MIVLKKIAPNVAKVFDKLFHIKFPIHKIYLAHYYLEGGECVLMKDNITSGFNHRLETASDGRLSPHAWVIAIDITPLHPSYKKNEKVFPSKGSAFTDRTTLKPGMIESIVHIFKEAGFTWGEDNTLAPDCHHFQFNTTPLAPKNKETPKQ